MRKKKRKHNETRRANWNIQHRNYHLDTEKSQKKQNNNTAQL